MRASGAATLEKKPSSQVSPRDFVRKLIGTSPGRGGAALCPAVPTENAPCRGDATRGSFFSPF
jgi:hypothetical protein